MSVVPIARTSVYDTPRLRPILQGEGDVLEARIDGRWRALVCALPLRGGDALAPTPEDGVLIAERLRARAPWLGALADKVALECRLAVATGRPWLHLSPTLLVGAPGTGKSDAARFIAEASGCAHAALDVGGASDSRARGRGPRMGKRAAELAGAHDGRGGHGQPGAARRRTRQGGRVEPVGPCAPCAPRHA